MNAPCPGLAHAPARKLARGVLAANRLLAAGLLLLLALSAPAMAAPALAADSAQVRGYLYETEPGVMVLESDNGILYTLKGKNLNKFSEHTVDVVGDVSTDKSGNIYLQVKSLKPARGVDSASEDERPAAKK